MLYELLEPDFKHMDERGGLIQLVREGYTQVNYIFSAQNSVRGNHYHKINKEAFYIIRGAMTVNLQNIQTGERTILQVEKGDMFMVFPYVMHTFVYSEDTELISMYDEGVELADGEMDIYQME